jgi:hypothetical protein
MALDDEARLALCDARCGLGAEARDRAQQVLAKQATRYEPSTLALLALCESALGDDEPAVALQHGRRALEIAASGDWVAMIVDVRMTLARALRAAGDQREADVQTRLAEQEASGKQLALRVRR